MIIQLLPNASEKTICYLEDIIKKINDEKENTVLGTVLIVISLVVLTGVILFFALTGKNGKGKNTKKALKVENNAEETEVATEEVEAEVEESSNEDEAKSGDVE